MACSPARLAAIRDGLASPSPAVDALLDRVNEMEREATGLREALTAALAVAHDLHVECVRQRRELTRLSDEFRAVYRASLPSDPHI